MRFLFPPPSLFVLAPAAAALVSGGNPGSLAYAATLAAAAWGGSRSLPRNLWGANVPPGIDRILSGAMALGVAHGLAMNSNSGGCCATTK